jgi:hypothetical protein
VARVHAGAWQAGEGVYVGRYQAGCRTVAALTRRAPLCDGFLLKVNSTPIPAHYGFMAGSKRRQWEAQGGKKDQQRILGGWG